jgi:Flp pilus assembly protein TadG
MFSSQTDNSDRHLPSVPGPSGDRGVSAFSRLTRFLRRERGTATVEFAITIPIVLAMMFTSIDFGTVMLRQVFLDRAVDMAAREVRLGQITNTGFENFRSRICARTVLLRNCNGTITIEMRPVDTATWANLQTPARCVNRQQNITPVLAFVPGAGNQELMLIQVCVAADPFIRLTGFVMGMGQNADGIYNIVSRAAWVNEPV